jgi:hypothetical protein
MDDVVPPSIGVASDAGGPADAGAAAAAAAAPPSKRLRTQTGAASAMTEERRTSSSGMQGGVGKLHSCIVKVRLCDQIMCKRAALP